jgi:enamine deaminase RidA (YjgF/YER057c/UK114 family)
VNVFLADMRTFAEMNRAYLEVMGEDPPARITVGRADLALGGAVEIDCVAYKPGPGR